MTISAVGTLASINYPTGGATLAVNPVNVNDLMVVTIETGGTRTITSITSGSGGVTTWFKALQWLPTGDREIWFGVVTATGPSNIAFNWNTTDTTHNVEYSAQEFTAGASATWQSIGVSNEISNPLVPGNTNVPFPSLMPTAAGQLYIGFAVLNTAFGGQGTGSTAGYTFEETAWTNMFCYNTNCTAATQSPVGAQTPAAASDVMGFIFKAVIPFISSPPVLAGQNFPDGSTGVVGSSTINTTVLSSQWRA